MLQRKITAEEMWHEESEAAKNNAQNLPCGNERNALLRKAHQLKTASQMNQWLFSPELKPPE
jgi:hypothetical protein